MNVLFKDQTLQHTVVSKFICRNIGDHLIYKIRKMYEGRCCEDGYVKKNSCELVSFSAAKCDREGFIFNVTFSCKICLPVRGNKLFGLKVKSTTAVGIKGTLSDADAPDQDITFLEIIVLLDTTNDAIMNTLHQDAEFSAEIQDSTFQLGDTSICVFCSLLDTVIT